MSKLCLIFNTAPLYRTSIYCRIDEQYDCKWVFGPKRSDIKEMDFSLLKDVSFYSLMGNANRFSIKRGMLKYLFKREYQTYLMYPETHSLTDWLFFVFAFTFFKKKRIYLWTHGWYGKESKMESSMKKWLFKHAAGIFSYSNYARDLMAKNGIDSNKIYTIHNSLDYDKQLALRKNLQKSSFYKEHFGNGFPVIVMIGRLNIRKKLDMLIKAVACLQQKNEYFNVVFIGDGEDRQELELLAKKSGIIDRVWFYGACFDEDINAKLLYNSDLCVIPGDIGLTVIHALTLGVPVISHNCFKYQGPEFEAIIPGVTGGFFEYDNMNSLVDSISKWFKNNSQRREIIRESCYKEIDSSWNPYYQMEVIKAVLK